MAAAISGAQRVELVQKENGGIGVLATAAFGAQLMADFSAGDQDTAGVPHFRSGTKGRKRGLVKFLDA